MGIVLARLLTPSEFGLVALALSILAVTHIVQESGLHASLIVYLGDMRRAAASAFVFTPFMGAALYAACFLAPRTSLILREPALTEHLRVTAIIVPLRSLMIVPGALLERGMQFGRIAVIEITAGVVQASTTIVLALVGAGAWSLVAQRAGGDGVVQHPRLAFAPMRPSFGPRVSRPPRASTVRPPCRRRQRDHVRDRERGGHGRRQAARDRVARKLQRRRPVRLHAGHGPRQHLGRGVFAAMARLQDDLAGCRRLWLENVQRLALVTIPAASG